jgi:hypothetical protein
MTIRPPHANIMQGEGLHEDRAGCPAWRIEALIDTAPQPVRGVVVDGGAIHDVDLMACEMLVELDRELGERGIGLAFGNLRDRVRRRDRTARIRWLDLHNLLGIAATAWLLVVGVIGVINTLTLPLLSLWQRTEVADMTAAWRGRPGPAAFCSAQQAVDTALRAAPGMDVSFIGFPGSRFSTPHHYMVFMRGDTALTSRLLKPVMIDAEDGALVDSRTLPWYLAMILLSQPLHFGD